MAEEQQHENQPDGITLHQSFFVAAFVGLCEGSVNTGAQDEHLLKQAWDFATRLEAAFKGANLWSPIVETVMQELAADLLRVESIGKHNLEYALYGSPPRRAFERAAMMVAMMRGDARMVSYPDHTVPAAPPPAMPANALPPVLPPVHPAAGGMPMASAAQVRVGFGGIQVHQPVPVQGHAPPATPHPVVPTAAPPAPAIVPLPTGGTRIEGTMGGGMARVVTTITPLPEGATAEVPVDWVDPHDDGSNKAAAVWRRLIPDLPARVEPAKDLNGRAAALRNQLIEMFKMEHPDWSALFQNEQAAIASPVAPAAAPAAPASP